MSQQVYSCLVVDDEPPAREVLKRYIEKIPMLRLAGECSNALQVMPMLKSTPVAIIFLDIRMPQISGIELISTLQDPPRIIFTTAFEEYALQSYELSATDYLLKPIQFERFARAVNKAISATVLTETAKTASTNNESFIYFRADRKMVKVLLNEIVYIESLKDYVKVVTDHGQVITRYSMAALEAILSSIDFLRIHRSFIISIKKIRSYTPTHIQVANTELPIGKLYQREVIAKLSGKS